MASHVNLADWVGCTEVEGPGKRFTLWVQGCLLKCPGCCNQHMLEIAPRNIVSTDEVMAWLNNAKSRHDIEGVTFLGGEPMLQARGLAEIAKGCRELKLSVMAFTGYTLDDLTNNPMPGVTDLLSHTDLLVAGPFIQARSEGIRNWVGSTNQIFHFLTDRYQAGIEYDPVYSHGFELRLFCDGHLQSNGWPSGLDINECGR